MKYYLAIDIGASSGRHIIGYKDNNNELILEEVYRFKNSVVNYNDHLIWDIDRLTNEVIEGIKVCLNKYKHIESLSIDTWGVDYVLMNNDNVIYPVYAYRDKRNKEVIDKVHNIISFEKLYKITGTQFQEFNTIYQLYHDMINNRLAKTTDFLYIPEYLMYKLTGIKVHELTNASTSGMLDKDTNYYSKEIIDKLGFDYKLFNKLSSPGIVIGDLKKEIQRVVNGNIKVVLCATHDTASAVHAIKMDDNSPYISSGTWSLLGIKTNYIITSNKALNCNYSNEYGINYYRFQKNIMGLWIIQCLAKGLNLDFTEMVNMAKKSNYNEIFDVNDNCFLSSSNMKNEIINYFNRNNQKLPKDDNDLLNSTYHSLAYSYKIAIEELESILEKKFDNLYIVGGGAKNQYLNDLCQKYTNKNVIALAIEASAMGNIIVQMEKENEKRN